MNQINAGCPICRTNNTTKSGLDYLEHDYNFYNCPNCGRFVYCDKIDNNIDKDKYSSYLYYKTTDINTEDFKNNKLSKFYNFIGPKSDFEKVVAENYWAAHLTNDVVNSWYPTKFNDKIDKFLILLSKKTRYMGEILNLNDDALLSACFCLKSNKKLFDSQADMFNQVRQFLNYLKEKKYIEYSNNNIRLLPEGWKRVDELQQSNSNNKNVFVSMAFNDGTFDTRQAIKEGIIGAGYSPEFIDEIIHNKQIVPEMFRLIRECRFLILEITDPNYGAYYEAGYALGLGKEVIICCKSDVKNRKFTIEEEKYKKYLIPHFDIAQKQILFWDNYEDLSKKLNEWIKAIIG